VEERKTVCVALSASRLSDVFEKRPCRSAEGVADSLPHLLV
jgi:hypothetical protein